MLSYAAFVFDTGICYALKLRAFQPTRCKRVGGAVPRIGCHEMDRSAKPKFRIRRCTEKMINHRTEVALIIALFF